MINYFLNSNNKMSNLDYGVIIAIIIAVLIAIVFLYIKHIINTKVGFTNTNNQPTNTKNEIKS